MCRHIHALTKHYTSVLGFSMTKSDGAATPIDGVEARHFRLIASDTCGQRKDCLTINKRAPP